MTNLHLTSSTLFPLAQDPEPLVPDPRRSSPRVSAHFRSQSEASHVTRPLDVDTKMDTGVQQHRSQHPSSPVRPTALFPSVAAILADPASSSSASSSPSPRTQSSPQTPASSPPAFHLNRSQSLRAAPEYRQRVISGGHAQSLRCSPDCTASNPPFHLLTRAIGRASATNVRRTLAERPSPLSRGHISSPRFSLQTRRSHTKSTSDPSYAPLSQSVPPPALSFNRAIWEKTPPIPVAESSQLPTSLDFPSDFGSNSSSTTTAGDNPMDGILGFYGPRNSSAPNVSIYSHTRTLSDASIYTALSSPSLGHMVDSMVAEGQAQERPSSTSLHSEIRMGDSMPTSYQSGVPQGRHAKLHSKRPDPNDRLGPFGRIIGDPVDLAGYLGPELAATLKRRLEEQPGSSPEKKPELLREAEWSFQKPLEKVMRQVAAIMVSQVGDGRSMYGCDTDTPNPIIADIIKGIGYTARDFKAKKLITVTHQCSPSYDIRALQAALASDANSYRNIKTFPVETVLSSFTFASFGEVSFAPASVDLGIGRGELSRLHGLAPASSGLAPITHREERDKLAHRDLKRWLAARAKEIRSGGLLTFYCAVRTGPPSFSGEEMFGGRDPPRASPLLGPMSLPDSPRSSMDGHLTPNSDSNLPALSAAQGMTSPVQDHTTRSRPDMWQSMNQTLSQAVQRLVTLGEIRPYVASSLVDVPFWPRSLDQMRKTFDKMEKWEVLRDYGRHHLAEQGQSEEDANYDTFPFEERRKWLDAGIRLQRLTHPAWKDFVEGNIDRQSYALHVATYCRAAYEDHLKRVLREKGKMDISRTETAIQELFKILVEKCEFGALEGLELDIGVVILRRK
ncbi:hypothetical protein BCR39DRAFT_225608 [Naematelia encephala]|uniref:Uncharacterized protein n=1 Tax=Naematelia encephala TaxID=71784 RepID=A0A1Y2AZM8_9TREE|nr:hypothetical protein BCR39DRAFT_225608 [Naematelia encephala]